MEFVATSDGNRAVIKYQDIILKQKIGEGAFGVVYQGEYKKTEVAVKVLKPGAASTPKDVADFLSEARTMSRLPPHPNVVKCRI